MPTIRRAAVALFLAASGSACAHRTAAEEHAGHGASSGSGSQAVAPVQDGRLPPGATEAGGRLASSPRHGEWVMVPLAPGAPDSVRAWVVYPERGTKAPVVVVVHEVYGLSTWIRSVADQLAAEGFVAIAPDLLTGKPMPGSPDSFPDSAVKLIRALTNDEVQRQLDAVASYARTLPASNGRYGIVGFCWGGGVVWSHAAHAGERLGAGVSYYGGTTSAGDFTTVRAPILGLYGGEDQRVNGTVPHADSAMKALAKVYEHQTFAGAGHGFLRQQAGQNGANLAATQAAWPRTVAWLRTHLDR